MYGEWRHNTRQESAAKMRVAAHAGEGLIVMTAPMIDKRIDRRRNASEGNPEATVSKLARVELSIERRRDNNLSMTII